ncbi:MAG: hypothetical protein HRT57_16685 [Crocinitomicaceae bacterium]|nr:hypothetical protein [Crocinitomicaceae bacterium]
MLDIGEQIQYDWALSRSYSVIISSGIVSIGTDVTTPATRTAIGLYRVPLGEKLICTSTQQAVFLTPFILDDAIMEELFPIASTLSQLRGSSSYLMPFALDDGTLKFGQQLVYDTTPGNISLSLASLETKTLGALGL